jgi:3-phosphoshikimate 1-carboxyvinyltransferase
MRSIRSFRGIPGRDFLVEDVRGGFAGEIEIRPLDAPPDVEIPVPGSKSVTNRALIIAALSDGETTLENPLFSDDSFWLMKALHDLGFGVEAEGGSVRVAGRKGEIPEKGVEVFVGNAGTAARFLPPMLALGEGPYFVDGVPRMRERPIGDLVGAMRSLGASVGYAGKEGKFPLVLEGGGTRGGKASVAGGKSSQFLSGIMMSSPYAENPVELEVTGGLVSRPYIGITMDVMRSFGVEVEEAGGKFTVEPSVYRARRYPVEPDASGASYFLAAAAVSGGRVRVPGLGRGSKQGDLRFAEILEMMGCAVEISEEYVEVRGPERLSGVEADMNEISDTFITLAAVAPFADGETVIKNIEHTRHQETDRISAVATELSRLGVSVEERRDGLTIHPGKITPARVETYDDHRIAMAFALVGLVVAGVEISNPACVSKTMPDYFERLELLRA